MAMQQPAPTSWLHRVTDSDVWWSFKRSPITVAAAVVDAVHLPDGVRWRRWIAPHNPFDLATLSLQRRPQAAGLARRTATATFPLGTDDQGRDMLSAIMYGARISLVVGFASVIVAHGDRRRARPAPGYVGGAVDAVHHARRRRAAHVPGDPDRAADRRRGARASCSRAARTTRSRSSSSIVAIGLSRLGAVRAHRARLDAGRANKEYVQAARVIGLSPAAIMVPPRAAQRASARCW